jgi:deoxyribose-phosphate aldolase
VDLQNLVEKITREVIDSLKEGKTTDEGSRCAKVSTPSSFLKDFTPSSFPKDFTPSSGIPKAGVQSAVLFCGSPDIDYAVLKSAVSFLKKQNFGVTVALAPGAPTLSIEDITVIRCSYTGDCSVASRNAEVVVILLPDIATISRLANLVCDRFDIEGALSALEAGKQVWGLNALPEVSARLSEKVSKFIKEIEGYGIMVCKPDGIAPATSRVSTLAQPAGQPAPTECSKENVGDCAGCGLCSQFITDQVKAVVNHGADRVSAAPGIKPLERDIAKMIDHTLLKPDATREQVIKLCEEAREHVFASVCINPGFVSLAAECLKGSPVKTCTVIGFPLGATTSMVKAMETRDAIAAGADEIDMVINVGALKAGDYDLVRRDIEAVVNAAQGRIVKVIIEAALLTDDEKVKACQLAKQAGADFVKTSTGFGPGGATAHDVALMRQTVGKYMGVKASGGIRDFATAQEMIKAGATRIGASASVAIVKGEKAKEGKGY